MKSIMKTGLFLGLALFFLSGTQDSYAQDSKLYEYATISYVGHTYVIAYPDGTTEGKKIGYVSVNNLPDYAKTNNDLFNMLADKGYRMVTSVASGEYLVYTFERLKEKK